MIALDKRKECIQNRKNLSLEEKLAKEKAIAKAVLPFLKGKIGYYVPIQNEVDIMDSLSGFDVYLPKMIDSEIVFYSRKETLVSGPFHTLEPLGLQAENNLDVILVPVVGFHSTYRMGYGKGFYDRYLSKFNGLMIGIAFDCQECDFEVYEHDVQLDLIITETRILKNENSDIWRQQYLGI